MISSAKKAQIICDEFDNPPADYAMMIASLSASISNHIFNGQLDDLKKIYAILHERFEPELVTPHGMLLGRIDALITFTKCIIDGWDKYEGTGV